jgi:epoxyqueuosine reductase
VSLAAIREAAAREHLFVSGAFHPNPADGLPDGTRTLILLSPDEPGFWPYVTAQPEFADGAANPLDRWSRRVVGKMACAFSAKARFPFGGPPWQPFVAWAQRSGQAWHSPVGLLVHARMGLFASYRGALALSQELDLPSLEATSPCPSCAQPCLSACPVAALGPSGYLLDACHGHLDSAQGADCLSSGCVTRRACPLSAAYGRLAEQSSWHMRQFHR